MPTRKPDESKSLLQQLFDEMRTAALHRDDMPQFNGGLFDGRAALTLEHVEIHLMFAAASLDWSLIDPTIFGTLFERFLDPDKRAQIGAHYTDPEKIMMIVEPVVARPLRREWEAAKAEIEAIMAPVLTKRTARGRPRARRARQTFRGGARESGGARDAFIDRLCALRILDPACGSGNFLYLALQTVKDIEYRAILECESLGLGMSCRASGRKFCTASRSTRSPPNSRARRSGSATSNGACTTRSPTIPRPILRKLDTIECRDALLTPDGKGGS